MMQYKDTWGRSSTTTRPGILHGEVLGVRDVITFQADGASGIEKAFRDSVDDYLAHCAERGEEPDKPFSGQFVVRMDEKLHRKLSLIAQQTGHSLNAVVIEYLRREAQQALPDACEKPENVLA